MNLLKSGIRARERHTLLVKSVKGPVPPSFCVSVEVGVGRNSRVRTELIRDLSNEPRPTTSSIYAVSPRGPAWRRNAHGRKHREEGRSHVSMSIT